MTNILNFDSRLNYQKIFTSGSVSITFGFPGTATIDHNLGYKPKARLWIETASGALVPAISRAGGISSGMAASVYGDLDTDLYQATYSVSNTQLKIRLYSFSTLTRTVYYRIYADVD